MSLFLARGKLKLIYASKLAFFAECNCLFIKEDTKQINCTVAIKQSWTKYRGHLFMKRTRAGVVFCSSFNCAGVVFSLPLRR